MNEMEVVITRIPMKKARFICGRRETERCEIALWPAYRNDYDNVKPLHKTSIYGPIIAAQNEAHTIYGSVSQTIVDKESS